MQTNLLLFLRSGTPFLALPSKRLDFISSGLQTAVQEVVKYKLRGLVGLFQSVFDHLCQSDPRLINCDLTIENSVKLMQLLQYFTQLLLPLEKFYWAVYNGTIAIYNIARRLMTAGFSSKVYNQFN